MVFMSAELLLGTLAPNVAGKVAPATNMSFVFLRYQSNVPVSRLFRNEASKPKSIVVTRSHVNAGETTEGTPI